MFIINCGHWFDDVWCILLGQRINIWRIHKLKWVHKQFQTHDISDSIGTWQVDMSDILCWLYENHSASICEVSMCNIFMRLPSGGRKDLFNRKGMKAPDHLTYVQLFQRCGLVWNPGYPISIHWWINMFPSICVPIQICEHGHVTWFFFGISGRITDTPNWWFLKGGDPFLS